MGLAKQIACNKFEPLSKVPSHEKVIWTKYQLDFIKIADF